MKRRARMEGEERAGKAERFQVRRRTGRPRGVWDECSRRLLPLKRPHPAADRDGGESLGGTWRQRSTSFRSGVPYSALSTLSISLLAQERTARTRAHRARHPRGCARRTRARSWWSWRRSSTSTATCAGRAAWRWPTC